MTVSHALEASESAPAEAPRCDCFCNGNRVGQQCDRPAVAKTGVRFNCGPTCQPLGWEQTDFMCSECLNGCDIDCVDCGVTTTISEPVRLRGDR